MLKTIVKRFSLPSPKFFVKLQRVGVGIAGFGVGIKGFATEYPDSKIIVLLQPFAVEFIVAGLTIALVAKLTVQPDVPNHKL